MDKRNPLADAAVHPTIAEIDPDAWDAMVPDGNPFMTYRFLQSLEASGCVGRQTSWHPRYVTVRDHQGLAGAMACYLKYDSYGEFIFDWQWADAFSRGGLRYYPKLTCAAPFTPAVGQRLLVRPDADYRATTESLVSCMLATADAERASSAHVLFCTGDECNRLVELDGMQRISHQYHWHNRDYGSFDDFLADLRSSKRKQIRKERRALADSDITVAVLSGDDITHEHMAAMYRFYIAGHLGKFGSPYLNQRWFEIVYDTMRDDLVLVLARDDTGWIAGTLNFRSSDHLYGRYWGSTARLEFLHFECCYYQLIEYAIGEGIKLFEAGAQGEHKFLRGFPAVETYSAHWVFHPGGAQAIDNFLQRERIQAQSTIAHYNRLSPLKHVRARFAAPDQSSSEP